MFTSRNFKALILLSASLLLLRPDALAQSGRRQQQPPGRAPGVQPAPPPADNAHHDRVKVVVSRGIEDFVKALNEQGRLGYRLEKTVNYGDPNEPQRYAAVLHLDPGHTYDYFSGSMPDDARYGDPLNYDARRGYTLAHAYAVTQCRQADVYDPHDPPDAPRRQETRAVRWNVLLFMRRDAAETQTKEYRVFRGLFALDGGQKRELQAALDAAPRGFRPVRLLFSTAGPSNFYVTVVAERDLSEPAPPKVEYEVVKEVFGFEDEVNRLAAAGSRYVVGGRNESVKVAVLERRAGGGDAYTFKDAHQHRKEFPRMLAAGNSYAGLLAGDRGCNVGEAVGQKLVFGRDAGGGPAREYRVLEIADHKAAPKAGVRSDAAVSELQRLLAGGFRVRDFVYAQGLYAILEKGAGARGPLARAGGR